LLLQKNRITLNQIFTTAGLTGLLALTFMEIMLGIDNVIFVSIILDKIEDPKQKKLASRIWMIAGLFMRLILLYLLSVVVNGEMVLFTIAGHSTTLSQLIMIGGGLFLLVNTTLEIHNKLEGDEDEEEKITVKKSFVGLVQKIVILDLVFSFDSIITAIGMAENIWVQVTSVMIAMLVMVVFSTKISAFISKHPTFKLLALSFLILIGFTLIVDGIHIDAVHVPHGYIYFAMAFSFGVELLNLQIRKKSKKTVKLQEPTVTETTKCI
jgi:predicted tellurium resistance membrane protein TerC